MNGQFLCNRPITCSYAFKKDAKGERHGTAAERLLAAQNPLFAMDRPHQIFSDVPGLRFYFVLSTVYNSSSSELINKSLYTKPLVGAVLCEVFR